MTRVYALSVPNQHACGFEVDWTHAGLSFELVPVVGDSEGLATQYRFRTLGARNKALEMTSGVAAPFEFDEGSS